MASSVHVALQGTVCVQSQGSQTEQSGHLLSVKFEPRDYSHNHYFILLPISIHYFILCVDCTYITTNYYSLLPIMWCLYLQPSQELCNMQRFQHGVHINFAPI